MNINVKETLEKVLAQQTYFKEIRYADDIGEWSAMIDDLTETPAIGVFFNDYSPLDWRGVPMVACDITYIVACDMLAPSEETAIMEEFLTNVNAFVKLLSPYIKAKPTEYRHWKDTVLRGVLTTVNFNAFSDCPPSPDGELVDYLQARNGGSVSQDVSYYNIFILPFYYFDNTEIEIKYIRSSANSAQYANGAYSLRLGASSHSNPTTEYDNLYNTWIIEKIQIANKQLTWQAISEQGDSKDGKQVLNYGKAPYAGFLQLFATRPQNNVSTQRIAYVKISKDGAPVMDARAYRRADGTPGLRDMVTGAFFAPQHDEGITAVSENELTSVNGLNSPLLGTKRLSDELSTFDEIMTDFDENSDIDGTAQPDADDDTINEI